MGLPQTACIRGAVRGRYFNVVDLEHHPFKRNRLSG
jgi:hypothetical protein